MEAASGSHSGSTSSREPLGPNTCQVGPSALPEHQGKETAHQFSNICDGASTKSRATLERIGISPESACWPELPCAVETCKLRPTQETMEHMSHFVEESDHIVMSHQSRFIGSWLGEIRDHSSHRITPPGEREAVSLDQRPHGSMRVFGF